MGRFINFTEEEQLNICEKYKNGISIPKLSAELAISRETVDRVLKSNNIGYVRQKNSKYIPTKEELDYILNSYKEGKGTNALSLEFKVTQKVIKRILEENGIEIRFPTKLKKVNENFFDNIDSEAKAYFLGWMFADGCVMDRSYRTRRMIISIQEGDIGALEEFKKQLEFEGKIEIKRRLNRPAHHKAQASITISSDKLCLDLMKWGCVPRKSLILEWPKNLPEEFERAMLLGIFDGDGSVHSSFNKTTGMESFQFDIYGSKSICGNANRIIAKVLNSPETKLLQRGNIWMFTRSGNQNIRKIYEWLYKDANFFLHRKRLRMKEVFKYEIKVKSSKYKNVEYQPSRNAKNPWLGRFQLNSFPKKYTTKSFATEEEAYLWVCSKQEIKGGLLKTYQVVPDNIECSQLVLDL